MSKVFSSTMDAISAMRQQQADSRTAALAEYRELIVLDRLSQEQQARLQAVMSDLGFDPSHVERDRSAIEQVAALEPLANLQDERKQQHDSDNQESWKFSQQMNATVEEMKAELSRLRAEAFASKFRLEQADTARQRLEAIKAANPALFGVVEVTPAPLVSAPSTPPGRGLGPRRTDGREDAGVVQRGRGIGLMPVV